jgi:hypothetical protein
MTLSKKDQSAFDAYSRYIQDLRLSDHSANADRVLTSLMLRRVVPLLGGPTPKGERATQVEKQAMLDFLMTISAACLNELPELLEKAFSSQEKGNLRRARSSIKKFYSHLKTWGYFHEKEEVKKSRHEILKENEHKKNQFHSPAGQARKDWHNKNGKHFDNRYGRKKRKVYALMARKAVNTRGNKHTVQIFPEDYINKNLGEDLISIKDYQKRRNFSKFTIEKYRKNIMQILGWLHRFRGIDLEELRLTTIINYSPSVTSLSELLPEGYLVEELKNSDLNQIPPDLLNKIAVKKMLLEEQSKKISEANTQLIQDFLSWLDLPPASQIVYVNAFGSVARYIYRKELEALKHERSIQIHTIQAINSINSELEKIKNHSSESVPFHIKSVTWDECIRTVEKLRQRYEEKFTYQNSKRGKSGIYSRKRTTYALARDLQDLLSLSLMVAISPDRSRTYYELELGRTLLYGRFEGRSFTPVDRLEDTSQAAWYIHLGIEDYKTGKSYGNYWAPIPNQKFTDGKRLYDYIDEWLSWGRESHGPVDHNFFFRGVSDRGPLHSGDWRHRIVSLMDRETGVGVSPKEFRRIYVSFLKSQRATNAQLEAARIAQHHSKKMQDSVYDQREQMDKLAPIYEFNEEIIGNILESMANQADFKGVEISDSNKQDTVIKYYENVFNEAQIDYVINKESAEILLSEEPGTTARVSANSSFQDGVITHALTIEENPEGGVSSDNESRARAGLLLLEGDVGEAFANGKSAEDKGKKKGAKEKSKKSKHANIEEISEQQLSFELN